MYSLICLYELHVPLNVLVTAVLTGARIIYSRLPQFTPPRNRRYLWTRGNHGPFPPVLSEIGYTNSG